MTIQFPSHLPIPGAPMHMPGDDSSSKQVGHPVAGAAAPMDPSKWTGLPSDAPTDSASHKHAGITGGLIPLPAPPAGDANPATQKNLTGKFGDFVDQNAGDGSEQNGQDGDGSGGGNTVPPKHHFTIDDLLSLLVNESAQGFQIAATQTQLATTEKITALDDVVKQISDAGHDRKIAGILGGVGTMVAGAAQIGAAGINLKGISSANTAIDRTSAAMEENEEGAMNALQRSQMFNNLTAGPQAWSQLATGSGQMIQGAFNVAQTMMESAATKHDAAKAEDEKTVAASDALHDNSQSMKQQALQVMQDYIERNKGIEQSRNQTMTAIAHI